MLEIQLVDLTCLDCTFQHPEQAHDVGQKHRCVILRAVIITNFFVFDSHV